MRTNLINLIIKRIFDLILSFMGIVITVPIFLILGITVKFSSKGSILFKQVRVGKRGKTFKILKFRTMYFDSDKKGLQITVGKDSRVTPAGRFLRKTKLDELPQLINILKGDMSFVGPRPEVPKYTALYNDEQRQILNIKPGITDYASICFRNESEILAQSDDPERKYIEEIMPLKIKYNMKYMKNINIFTDIKIIFMTLWVVLGGKADIKI